LADTVEIGNTGTAVGALTGTETVTIRQSAATVDTTTAAIAALAGAASIADDSVTNAKLANMTAPAIKGRSTAGTGDPEDLSGAQVAVIAQGDGLDVDAAGFRGLPVNSQSGNYPAVAADSCRILLHPNGAGAGDTFTIPANASVAYEVGTALTFINRDSNALTIAITSDTLIREGTTTTGSRTLAQNGMATAVKVEATVWLISGGSALT
jgi:hypothetical protein